MSEPQSPPRHWGGLALIALLLGAGPLMLWMGRGKLALLYFCLTIVAIVSFFAASINDLIPIEWFVGAGLGTPTYLALLVVAVFAFLHALRLRTTALQRPWFSRWYVALPTFTVVSVALALFVQLFRFQPFNSPTTSMVPSLMQGDHYFVDKTAYRNGHTPQQGDIAAFVLSADESIAYVKRVIGLPGDHIRMTGGVLHINGQPAMLEPLQLPPEFYENTGIQFYRETLSSGRSYVIADMQRDGAADDTDEYIVPVGHYFMMGGNRDNSQDSRYLDAVGYVPKENFIGPVVLRYWNSMGFKLGNRPVEQYSTK